MIRPHLIARLAPYALLAGVLASCAGSGGTRSTPYEQMGGGPGIEGIVDDLLLRISDDPRINHKFANANIVRLRGKLVEQLCAQAGGPCVYTGLGMREAHAGHGIGEADFNALVENLVAVMEARRVPVSAQNRLLQRLARMHGEVVER